jgi:hypothetical protein
MAFGAVTTASLAACGAGSGPLPGGDGGDVDASADAGPDVVIPPPFDGSIAKPYGTPPADGLWGV